MPRRVSSLGSLHELHLSESTQLCLIRKTFSLADIVWYGRHEAYYFNTHPDVYKRPLKSTAELIQALDRNGFIRHDITAESFHVNRLYRDILSYGGVSDTIIPCGIDELGNEKYENFENPTPELVEKIKAALKACLTKKEYGVILCRYGLEDGQVYTLKEAGKRHELGDKMYAGVIERKALRKLARHNTLPDIVVPSNGITNTVTISINQELEKRFPADGIEHLEFSTRTYNTLKRARINTVSDMIELPKEQWLEIKNFGRKSLQEVVDKLHAAGYVDFTTTD